MSSTEVTTQTPAGWVALSAGDRHLVVQGSAALAQDLRGPLEAGLVEVLEALSRDGLRALPDFALADTSGEQARVVVRGSAVVRADGDEVLADGRMPWRDLDLSAAALELAGPGGRGGWKRPKRLGRPASTASAAPEPVVESAVEPEPEAVPEPEPVPVPEVADAPDAPSDDADDADAPAPAAAAAAADEPDTVDEPAAENPLSPAALAPPVPPADLTLPPSEEYAGAAPAERVTPEPQPRAEKKVLIDSVPWRTLPDGDRSAAPSPGQSAPEPAVAEPPAAPVPDATDGPTGPDNWGLTGPPPSPPPVDDEPAPAVAPWREAVPATEAMQVPAPEPEPDPEPEAVASNLPPVPDVTMDRSSLNPGTDGPADSPIVLAVICPAGHHSSPHASSCRVCGRDIPTQQPFQTPRPQLGVFRVSTGGLVPLDRGILLGRSPKVNSDLPPSSRPHLVRLASKDNDISRNHAEVILEGWHVLVRDLGSTNGTTVTLPGQEPVRLRPTEDFGIEPGAIITLADEVALTYEVAE